MPEVQGRVTLWGIEVFLAVAEEGAGLPRRHALLWRAERRRQVLHGHQELRPDRAADFSAIDDDFIAITGDIAKSPATDQADITAGADSANRSQLRQRQMCAAGNYIAIQL